MTHVRRNRTTFSRRSPPFSVEPLYEGHLGQGLTTGWTLLRSDRLQQKAPDRPRIRAALVGARRNRTNRLRPHLAAVERTLPRRIAERQRFRGCVIRVRIGTEK